MVLKSESQDPPRGPRVDRMRTCPGPPLTLSRLADHQALWDNLRKVKVGDMSIVQKTLCDVLADHSIEILDWLIDM